MSITDELREWCVDRVFMGNGYAEVLGIADRIDAAHRSALEKLAAQVDESERSGFDQGFASADDWLAQHEDAMAEHGWIRLPVDADGVTIRIGDVVTMQLLFGGESKPLVVDRMELSHGRDGDLWYVALDTDKECWNQPLLMRHYTQPTVEDVLREFAREIDADAYGITDAKVAEFAAKLRLAEGVDR